MSEKQKAIHIVTTKLQKLKHHHGFIRYDQRLNGNNRELKHTI